MFLITAHTPNVFINKLYTMRASKQNNDMVHDNQPSTDMNLPKVILEQVVHDLDLSTHDLQNVISVM